VYLPAFALQVAVRRAPHQVGRPLAVLGAGARPAVYACSRAARALGAASGQPVARASALPGVELVAIAPAELEAARVGLAEALMARAPATDLGDEPADAPHRALFVEVPAGVRAARFAADLLDELAAQGLRGRIAIADDRFTARAVAAHARDAITVVPRRGGAAALAPLPLDLLPLGPEVRAMFRALGVATIGGFAALPPPSIGRPRDPGADPHALARGDGPRGLRRYVAGGPVREAVVPPPGARDPLALERVLRPAIERACRRLRGRGAAACRLELALGAGDGAPRRAIALPRASRSPVAWQDALRRALDELAEPPDELRLAVVEDRPLEAEPIDWLFDRGLEARPTPGRARRAPAPRRPRPRDAYPRGLFD
jgi:nucleotidyltransferase/DNA polymerase involved in DNA repair